jgi:[ribosomal protein S18]-alanine N-acetyltransferase
VIRPATKEDAPAITVLERDAFGADAWSETLVELELTAPGRVVVVAEQDDVLVGYASAAMIADVADLTRIAVGPGARRAGVARLLLGTLLDEVAAQGAERMMLEVADTNAAALGLYAASGFVEIARRRDYYGRGLDAVVMELAPITHRDRLET